LRERVNRLTIAVEALRACAVVGLKVAYDTAVVGGGDIMFVGLLSPALTTFGSAPQTQNAESAICIVKLRL
jgi:DNA-binding LacI/PurR family transcriptional regulator